MEAIKTFFQDASNACAYANECGPDLSFLKPHEPFTALFTVAAVCYLTWRWNERRIARRKRAAVESASAPTRELREMLGALESDASPGKKLAA